MAVALAGHGCFQAPLRRKSASEAAHSSPRGRPGTSWGSHHSWFFISPLVAAAARRREAVSRLGRAAQERQKVSQVPKVDRTSTDPVRKAMYRSEDYYKFSRNEMVRAIDDLKNTEGSDLLRQVRQDGFAFANANIQFTLAESYGFCWGVERAIAMAYEARSFFPDARIWCTNEIIHNPSINGNLKDQGMKFIHQDKESGIKDFSVVQKGDVVLLPAFGASVDEMAFLQDVGCKIVDTTCPWVAKVWGSVESSKRKGHTSIVHGKYNHEETIATLSFAKSYVCVANLAQAEYVAKYVLEGGSKSEFLEKFKGACSEGFDPDVDLERVGMANQTTMMKSETVLIGQLFERTMIKKYGPTEVSRHFITTNTICDATQDRQSAMYKLIGKEPTDLVSKMYATLEEEQVSLDLPLQSSKLKKGTSSKSMEDKMKGAGEVRPGIYKDGVDLVIILGGFNSSNTLHLLEIADENGALGYHIDQLSRLGGADGNENSIVHKPLITPVSVAVAGEGLSTTKDFLPPGPVKIGLTSGASTPDHVLQGVIERLIAIKEKVDAEATSN